MLDIFTIVILVLAGVLAGVVTGLAGASAVMVMAPLLIIFLNMDPYIAIGLSLCTDVVASLVASKVYYKNKHINLIPAIPILLAAFVGITLGSYLSVSFPQIILSGATGIGIFTIGLFILIRRNAKERKIPKFLKKILENDVKRYTILAIIGLIIGLQAGIFGAGGGLALLAAFIFFLNYRMHTAIGTSVLVMVFISFFGSVTHYYYKPFSSIFLFVAVIGGFFGARYSSIIANLTSERNLKTSVGIIFLILGTFLILKSFLPIGFT